MTKTKRLIFLNLTAQHLLKKYLINEFKKNGIKISPAHTGILFALLEKPISMNDLSKLLHIKNSTVTGLIDRLEVKGFVFRVPDSNDRRKLNISITKEGIEEINKAKLIIHRVNDEIKEGFTDKEIDSMIKILKSFFHKFKE